MTDPRFQQLMDWVRPFSHTYHLNTEDITPVSGDASQRRYFRLSTQETGDPEAPRSYLLMDDPVGGAGFSAFLDIRERLAKAGCYVPTIHEHSLEKGFMLLEDLGGINYYAALHSELSETQRQLIYRDALQALTCLQSAETEGLPVYTHERLMQELGVFTEWYLQKHLGYTLKHREEQALHDVFEQLIEAHLDEGQVLVHRDYHSPNLMLTAQRNPGIIDFQDAVKGPISYDVASLCLDARFTIAEIDQIDWAARYWGLAKDKGLPVPSDFALFHEQFEWMSLQRNLRILGTFARLAMRDGKPRYLEHMPRVLGYVRQITHRYGVFAPLNQLLDRTEGITPQAAYTF